MATQQTGQTSYASADGGRCVCSICQAGYVPSQSYTFLWQASPIALESALMSMCRFCFRCRRPACPECWDEVHGVCGACTEEAHLPFRRTPAPLDGTLLPPSHQPQVKRISSVPDPLICVRPGRFQEEISSECSHPEEELSDEDGSLGEEVEDEIEPRPGIGIGGMIERIITAMVVVVLVVLVVLILLAWFSARANGLIFNVLHVDIHGEIAYLLLLIKS